jgi:hypothetical protein
LFEVVGAGELAAEFFGKELAELVLGDAHGLVAGAQGVLDFEVVFFGTEDDADGGVFFGEPNLFVEEFEVEVHLARKLRLEGPDFEVNGHEAMETAVEEEEVHVVGLVGELEGVLVADEGEAVAEFEEEVLELVEELAFQFEFEHGFVDAEEFEAVTALDDLVGLFGEVFRQGLQEIGLLGFQLVALVGLCLYLVEQHVTAPGHVGGGLEVVGALFVGCCLVQNDQVLPSRNFCDKLSQIWEILICLVQPPHIP